MAKIVLVIKILAIPLSVLMCFWVYEVLSYKVTGGMDEIISTSNPKIVEKIYYNSHRPLMNINEHRVDKRKRSRIKRRYWNAIRKFPSLSSCIIQDAGVNDDSFRMSWAKLRTSTQAEVCLYHVSSQFDNAEDFGKWLETQGFAARVHYGEIHRMLPTGDKFISINANWSKTNESFSPYPLFSWLTYHQFSPLSWLTWNFGYPSIQIIMDESLTVFEFRVNTRAAK